MTDEFQEYPKMLYKRGPGNVLDTLIVDSAEAEQEAGSDWKTKPPQPRGRPVGSVNKPKTEETEEETGETEPEAPADDDT